MIKEQAVVEMKETAKKTAKRPVDKNMAAERIAEVEKSFARERITRRRLSGHSKRGIMRRGSSARSRF